MLVKPAKKLSLLLQTRVILEVPSTTSGVRFGAHNIEQFNLVSNMQNMFMIGTGPVLEPGFVFSLTEDQAFEGLADVIKEFKKVRFHLPILPVNGGIENCSADIHRDVAMRMIEYYEVHIDEVLTRYDVLVEKLAD